MKLKEGEMIYDTVNLHKLENGWQVCIGYFYTDSLRRSWSTGSSTTLYNKYWVYPKLLEAMQQIEELAYGAKTQWEAAKEEEGE